MDSNDFINYVYNIFGVYGEPTYQECEKLVYILKSNLRVEFLQDAVENFQMTKQNSSNDLIFQDNKKHIKQKEFQKILQYCFRDIKKINKKSFLNQIHIPNTILNILQKIDIKYQVKNSSLQLNSRVIFNQLNLEIEQHKTQMICNTNILSLQINDQELQISDLKELFDLIYFKLLLNSTENKQNINSIDHIINYLLKIQVIYNDYMNYEKNEQDLVFFIKEYFKEVINYNYIEQVNQIKTFLVQQLNLYQFLMINVKFYDKFDLIFNTLLNQESNDHFHLNCVSNVIVLILNFNYYASKQNQTITDYFMIKLLTLKNKRKHIYQDLCLDFLNYFINKQIILCNQEDENLLNCNFNLLIDQIKTNYNAETNIKQILEQSTQFETKHNASMKQFSYDFVADDNLNNILKYLNVGCNFKQFCTLLINKWYQINHKVIEILKDQHQNEQQEKGVLLINEEKQFSIVSLLDHFGCRIPNQMQ